MFGRCSLVGTKLLFYIEMLKWLVKYITSMRLIAIGLGFWFRMNENRA